MRCETVVHHCGRFAVTGKIQRTTTDETWVEWECLKAWGIRFCPYCGIELPKKGDTIEVPPIVLNYPV